jgi:hypothetical protein
MASPGMESATVIGYLDLNLDFSQFDRDNMNRNLIAAYINQLNAILAKILASPRANNVSSLLSAADQQAEAALNIYQTMDLRERRLLRKGCILKGPSCSSANKRACRTASIAR